MELRHQLTFLRSALPIIILTTLIAAAVAFAVSRVIPPSYEARVVLAVGQSTDSSSDLNALQVSQRLSQTYAALAVTDIAARDVIQKLQLDMTPAELLGEVSANVPTDSTLLTLIVQDRDPAQAATIADAFAARMITGDLATSDGVAQEFRSYVDEDLVAIRAQIDRVQSQIDALIAIQSPSQTQLDRLTALEDQGAMLRNTFATLLGLSANQASPNRLSIADPATVPTEPVSPRLFLNVALGAALGAVLGIVLAYMRRRLDDTIRTPEELEAVAGVPVLGAIVRMPGDAKRPLVYRLATLLYPRSPAAEGFRHVRTGIEFSSGDIPLKTLLITSPMAGDGKTTVASNLAVAFAQAGRTVCIVDADLRKPDVHTVFGIPNGPGLSEALRGDELTFDAIAQATEVEGLRLIRSGQLPANPAELIASPRMRAVLASLAERVDLVILDSPPLQAVTDATILASMCDGTVLVVGVGHTRRAQLVRASETLLRVGARVLGTTLNALDQRSGEDAAFGYFTYYGKAEDTDPQGGTAPVGQPGLRRS